MACMGMPVEGGWRVGDLDAMPSGLRHELVDGVLLSSARPSSAHQLVVIELAFLLRRAQTAPRQTLTAPFDFRPNGRRSLQPDILVVRREDIGSRNVTGPVLAAVEVLSEQTRELDRTLKREVYRQSGVASYWLVDPAEPSVTVLELDEAGRYQLAGLARGDQLLRVSRPFPVELVPARLVEP